MHRLLTRQLKRHFGKDFDYDKLDLVMLGFVKNIAQTYDEYDKEQRFMENTVDRNSQELNSAYELIDQKNKNLSKLLDERSKLLENRIEENKEIEVALKQYKQAMDATLLIYKFDKDGVLTFVNENLSRTSGYFEEELIGKTFSALCAENTLKDGFSHILECVHNKELYRDQMTNAQKNGDFYYVNAVIFPLLDKEGNIVEFMGILQDYNEPLKSN
jgi:PAS domain S-box-containing protein